MRVSEPVPEVIASIAALTHGAWARNAKSSPTRELPESAADAPVEAEAPDLRQTVLQEVHDSPYKGHIGIRMAQKAVACS